MNEDLKTLRRKEDNLGISGLAVLLFSMWDIVRFVMTLIMNPHALTDFLKNMGVEPDEMVIGGTVVLGIYGIILVGAFLIRLFIYFGAKAESEGKKRGWLYVIVAALVLAFIVADQTSTIIDTFNGTAAAQAEELGELDTATVSGLLNITSAFALIDIILSSATVKSIRKKYNIKDGEVK
jgi:hypothetical protein